MVESNETTERRNTPEYTGRGGLSNIYEETNYIQSYEGSNVPLSNCFTDTKSPEKVLSSNM
jgi:hypothetical protein